MKYSKIVISNELNMQNTVIFYKLPGFDGSRKSRTVTATINTGIIRCFLSLIQDIIGDDVLRELQKYPMGIYSTL